MFFSRRDESRRYPPPVTFYLRNRSLWRNDINLRHVPFETKPANLSVHTARILGPIHAGISLEGNSATAALYLTRTGKRMIAFHALQMGSAFCGERWTDLSFESGVGRGNWSRHFTSQNIVIISHRVKSWLVFEVIRIFFLHSGLDRSNFNISNINIIANLECDNSIYSSSKNIGLSE